MLRIFFQTPSGVKKKPISSILKSKNEVRNFLTSIGSWRKGEERPNLFPWSLTTNMRYLIRKPKISQTNWGKLQRKNKRITKRCRGNKKQTWGNLNSNSGRDNENVQLILTWFIG